MAIEVGQEAPDFTLTSQSGDGVTLSAFRGERNVVLVFYPLAFSGNCTRQLTDIGAHAGRYAGADAQVLGVSVDSRFTQAAFARSLGLDAALLLADFEPKGEVARRYGVYDDGRGHARRGTFVIDMDGVVKHIDVAAPGEMPDQEGSFRALATCNA